MSHTYRDPQLRWQHEHGTWVLQEWFPCVAFDCEARPHGEWREVPYVQEGEV